MNIDREQFERLLSERTDGVLTPGQLAELDRALADHPEFAAQARAYDHLQSLLRRWRTVPVNMDWRALTAQIRQGLDEPVAPSTSRTVDDLVQGAFGPMPDVDWARLHARISSAVREDATARRTQRSWAKTLKWSAMVGAPLAAAAAIALTIWLPRSATPPTPAAPAPLPSKVIVAYETPAPAGRIKVAFDEKPYAGGPIEDDANGAAIASGPRPVTPRDPVDEVVLY